MIKARPFVSSHEAAFGEFLKNMLAPINPARRNGPPEYHEVQRFHFAGFSSILIFAAVTSSLIFLLIFIQNHGFESGLEYDVLCMATYQLKASSRPVSILWVGA